MVTTVTGPVSPGDLGVTLPHEHVLLDLTCLWHPPSRAEQQHLVDAALALENRGELCADPYVSRPNLRLDEPEIAVQEILMYRKSGGGTIVDLTVEGIGPQPERLREISQSTGVAIVAGCGFYVQRAHPQIVAQSSEEELAELMVEQIRMGFGETGIRPGIIGELGTSSPVHPGEEKVLRAAARAQRVTGLSINVHVAIFAREALAVLDVLERAGGDLSRVVVSHLDEQLDAAYHRAILSRGAYVELDTFGSELYFDHIGEREPSDAERIEALLRLLDEGWSDQLLLSQDVCTKMHLRRYGGFGYAHLLRTIVPRLRPHGIDDETLRRLLVQNPARILAHPPVKEA